MLLDFHLEGYSDAGLESGAQIGGEQKRPLRVYSVEKVGFQI